jgi:hypothetical protein
MRVGCDSDLESCLTYVHMRQIFDLLSHFVDKRNFCLTRDFGFFGFGILKEIGRRLFLKKELDNRIWERTRRMIYMNIL